MTRCSDAKAGHVTGGRVFGYDNVEVLGEPDGQGRKVRQRVERRINEKEAVVVRRIFELCALSTGYTFGLQALKAPIIDVVTRAGWRWQPLVWDAPNAWRWLTE